MDVCKELKDEINNVVEEIDMTMESLMYNINTGQRQVVINTVERLQSRTKRNMLNLRGNVHVQKAITTLKRTVADLNSDRTKLRKEIEALKQQIENLESAEAHKSLDDESLILASQTAEEEILAGTDVLAIPRDNTPTPTTSEEFRLQKPYDLENEGDEEPSLPPLVSRKRKTPKSATKTTSREEEKSTQKQKKIKLEEQGTKKPKKQGDD